MTHQPTLFTDDAEMARADAIARADMHADLVWKHQARAAVQWCADNLADFTADDVWWRLETVEAATTHEPSALGPVFMWAAKQRLIRKTGTVRPSRLARRHRDLTVWMSTKS